MNNFQNPFEGILSQMNQAKMAYDNTMSQLQGQLHQARQALNSYQPAVAQQSQPLQVTQPQQDQAQSEIPTGVQQITVLGEIKTAIEKTNELLNNFINGTPIKTASEKQTSKKEKDETPKT